jgi:P4 family phage/plasmid primase-like protien
MPEIMSTRPSGDSESALAVLFDQGQVIEVRALADSCTHSGYFTDTAALARCAEALDTDPAVHGIYVTLNDVNPALLARRVNRIKMHLSRSDATTGDADITRRRWFPIDIDPVRPGGVSSTDTEHDRALKKAEEIAVWLTALGFPEPVRGDSGNGAHLLYRIDLPNDELSKNLIQQCLVSLDLLFSDPLVSVDAVNYNAGRIWKLYGTMARKGDNTPERPHRRSWMLPVPESLVIVTEKQLHTLASQLPTSDQVPVETPVEMKGYKNILHLPDWLNDHGILVKSEKPYKDGRIYLLDTCPFSPAHKDGAYVIRFVNGAIFAGCHHASCGGRKQRWKELREQYETTEERQKRQEQRINAGKKERAKAKTAAEQAGIPSWSTGKQTGCTCSLVPQQDNTAYGELHTYPMTDAGNAERLIAMYGESVRYCATFNAWYLWNGTVWERDTSGRMLLIATDVARSIHHEAAAAPTADQSRAISRFALFSESLHARKAMIDSAAPHIPVLPGVFDAPVHLLNCRNGTLELDTMTFRNHRPQDLLTKTAAVVYDPTAACPQWLAHLTLLFAGDADYLSGFQSMCGYSLLGTNPQQVMFILYGKGRNGKSKTIEVLARILDNYAVNIAAESLVAKRFENARSDLARLAGARLATAAEGTEGARMDESIIKQITGEYAITVRKLYENEFEFTPMAKIWLTTNHEPVIRGTDDGIWRRIWMVPFAVQIPEDKCDPDIAAKLLTESGGILNWCLGGLKRFYENGGRLVQPRKVSVATGNLRTVSDTVGLFLLSECVFEPGGWISRTALNETFQRWCQEEGVRQMSPRKLCTALRERGVVDGGKVGFDRTWSGIRPKNENERIAFEQRRSGQETLSM